MHLQRITITPSTKFRQYELKFPRAPGVTGAYALTGVLFQTLWNPREHAPGGASTGRRMADGLWSDDLWCGERGQTRMACERTRRIRVSIDAPHDDLITVRADFLEHHGQEPFLWLVSHFHPAKTVPNVVQWSNG